jgi:hypothetical protein
MILVDPVTVSRFAKVLLVATEKSLKFIEKYCFENYLNNI